MTERKVEPLRRETDGFTFAVLGLLGQLRRLDVLLAPAGDTAARRPAAALFASGDAEPNASGDAKPTAAGDAKLFASGDAKPTAAGDAVPHGSDDAVLLAVLGACAVRRSLERWLEVAAHDALPPEPPRTPDAPLRGIVR